MYSDRIGASSNSRERSIRDRLGGNVDRLIGQRRPAVKRPRPDDSRWMHDMYEDEHGDSSPSTNRQNGSQDLRLKLSRKNKSKDVQTGSVSKVSNGETVKDIREKVSSAPRVEHDEHTRVTSVVRGSTAPPLAAAARPVAARTNNPSAQGKRAAVEELTVAALLQSLGLSKYLISFQAEEVDMAALRHMNDDDLKELGVPMGPRKKILLALARS